MLSQTFLFFAHFEAGVCLFSVLVEADTTGFTELLNTVVPETRQCREHIHNVQQQKRKKHFSSSVFSPFLDFSRLSHLGGRCNIALMDGFFFFSNPGISTDLSGF